MFPPKEYLRGHADRIKCIVFQNEDMFDMFTLRISPDYFSCPDIIIFVFNVNRKMHLTTWDKRLKRFVNG